MKLYYNVFNVDKQITKCTHSSSGDSDNDWEILTLQFELCENLLLLQRGGG